MAEAQAPAPARWRTAEFGAYYVVVASALAWMVVMGARVSDSLAARTGPEALRGVMLHGAWIPGRRVDASDGQWRDMRAGLPALVTLLGAHAAISRAAHAAGGPRVQFAARSALSVAFVFHLHGALALAPVALAVGNYALAKGLHALHAPRAIAISALWGVNVAMMLHVYVHRGYGVQVAGVLASLWGGTQAGAGAQARHLRAWQARITGVRDWHGTCFNFQVLRMVSFALDYWDARRGVRARACLEAGSYAAAVEESLPVEAYGLSTYLLYIFYTPLYLAGPIATFNAWAAQAWPGSAGTQPSTVGRSGASGSADGGGGDGGGRALADGQDASSPRVRSACSARAVLTYGARWGMLLLLLETMTHYLYFNAIATSPSAWDRARNLVGAAPASVLCAYWVLNFMWLKFATIWRLFRLGALADGVECPENMTRNVNESLDIQGFWKGWHASYNKWLVRYMYLPLGGSRWKLLNMWPIFTFVALWHDLEMKLFAWAWAMALFGAPEVVAKTLSARLLSEQARASDSFRWLTAFGASWYIVFLMAANLAGFVAGPEGAVRALRDVFVDGGLQAKHVAVGAMLFLFSLAHLNLEKRAGEDRRKKSKST